MAKNALVFQVAAAARQIEPWTLGMLQSWRYAGDASRIQCLLWLVLLLSDHNQTCATVM